mmetsp:Transcript_86187/g.278958  ORF Transcript_86187/g.278958 Transcript_86187/m.278958 type:complete len:203 (-) Transcript_86187:79-687(-)
MRIPATEALHGQASQARRAPAGRRGPGREPQAPAGRTRRIVVRPSARLRSCSSRSALPDIPFTFTIRSSCCTAWSGLVLFQMLTGPSCTLSTTREMPMPASYVIPQPKEPSFSTSMTNSWGLQTCSSSTLPLWISAVMSDTLPMRPFTPMMKSPTASLLFSAASRLAFCTGQSGDTKMQQTCRVSLPRQSRPMPRGAPAFVR